MTPSSYLICEGIDGILKMLYRKIISVWLAVSVYLLIYIIVLPRFNTWTIEYIKGIGFLILLQVMFVVPITLIYGVLISSLVERIIRKFKEKFKETTYRILYILLHAIFGLLFGLIFNNYYFMMVGTGVALLFSISDILLQSSSVKQRQLLYTGALLASGIILLLSILPHLGSL